MVLYNATVIVLYIIGNVLILVVGTKYDLVKANPHLREVTEESVETFINNQTSSGKIIGYYEVSAKDGTNIDEAFQSLAEALKERIDKADLRDDNCQCEQPYTTTPMPKKESCC